MESLSERGEERGPAGVAAKKRGNQPFEKLNRAVTVNRNKVHLIHMQEEPAGIIVSKARPVPADRVDSIF